MPRFARTFYDGFFRRSHRRQFGNSWFWLQIVLGSLMVACLIGVTALVTNQAVERSAQPIDVTGQTDLPASLRTSASTKQPVPKLESVASSVTTKQPVKTQSPDSMASESDQPTSQTGRASHSAPCNQTKQRQAMTNYRQALADENSRHSELLKKLVSSKGILRYIFPENNDAQIRLENDRHTNLLNRLVDDLQSALSDAHCHL